MTRGATIWPVSRPTALAILAAALAATAPGLALPGRAAPRTSLELDFSGQATGFASVLYDSALAGQVALRYIPDLAVDILPGWLDAEAAVNLRAAADARPDSLRLEAAVKPYRAWLRFGRERFEVRTGLQKLAFGSAVLLRPLQWFDRLDPRDPTGATDGVYALLGRYWFENNANLWAWGLVGNSEPKGWEQYRSERWTPEVGGRVQLPMPRGEVAATWHHRRVGTAYRPLPVEEPFGEDRLGLDGKWDIGIGLWFEATALHEWTDALPRPWQWAAVLGGDYTFGIGNGLTVTAEHLGLARTSEPLQTAGAVGGQATGLIVNYPLGLVDNVSAIALYDWQNDDVYAFAAWQRTLDRWRFQVAGFWSPDAPAAAGGLPGAAAGKGLRLTVVFNH